MPIKLEESGDSHNIAFNKLSNSKQLTVRVNLTWKQPASNRCKFFKKMFGGNKAPDLDLGCMYELFNREKGVIQPLEGNFGSKNSSPYIFMDKDNRTEAVTEGKNMYIFRPDLIKRIMFFGLVYNGVPDFKSVRGRMLFKVGNGEEVYFELNNPDSNRPFCSAAMVHNIGSQVVILKEEKYFSGHQEADKNYGFGFSWTAGSK